MIDRKYEKLNKICLRNTENNMKFKTYRRYVQRKCYCKKKNSHLIQINILYKGYKIIYQQGNKSN